MTRSLLPICSVTSFFHCRICFDAEILSIRFFIQFSWIAWQKNIFRFDSWLCQFFLWKISALYIVNVCCRAGCNVFCNSIPSFCHIAFGRAACHGSLCSSGDGDIKNRGRWAVQFQFIKDSSSLMIYCAIIPAVALFVFMLFYEISMANGYQIVGEGSFPWCAKELRMWGFSMRQQFLVG